MFALQNMPVADVSLAPDLTLTPIELEQGSTRFDLTLFMSETPQGYAGSLEYNTDLFDAETMRRLAGHFEMLLASGVGDPDRRVLDLPLLTAAEHRQNVTEANRTQVARAETTCLRLFEQQASATPDAVAICHGAQHLTYGALDRDAGRLATRLTELGVTVDTPVGLAVERSIEMAVGVLGIFKAGGACVPLDANLPASRLRTMLNDSQVPVVAADRTTGPQLPGIAVPRVDLPLSAASENDSATGCSHPASARPEHLAYVLYTSGSTGQPKGISLPHGVLANLIQWHAEQYMRAARTLQLASLSFDASFHEMLATWATGGVCCVASDELKRDPRALGELLAKERIEKAILPVVVLHNLAELVATTGLELPQLREVVTTGEQLQITAAVREMFERLPQAQLQRVGQSADNVAPRRGSALLQKAHVPLGGARLDGQVDLAEPAPVAPFAQYRAELARR